MEFDKKNIIPTIKHIVTLKRTKVTLYIALVLWIATMTQIAVNQIFYKNLKITDAFVDTKATGIESSIEIVGEYKADFLSEYDKMEIIRLIAKDMGLTLDTEIDVWKEDTRSIYGFVKQAKTANSEIKVVSMEQQDDEAIVMKHYVIVRLKIKESISSIDNYRSIITKSLVKTGITNQQVTMKYKGEYDGILSSERKDELANGLIKQLRGVISTKYEDEIYTVYAYTALIKEYIVNNDTKVNIQIVVSYDEKEDKTIVYLATPLLNESW